MTMSTAIEQVVHEAEQQLTDGTWDLVAADSSLVRETATALAGAIGPADTHQALPTIERLAALREAIAALAMTIARTHGHLAWFLAQCTSHLTPVLHWRALDAPEGRTFGAVLPTDDELTDAETAIRLLATMLDHTSQPT
ncbi:hypothetical protein ACIRVF_42695 [Kitasatospora sp. NPDC101157]|uniref:hypothetical protein n=1 Tax=Kitasatospora sp. NPDC101157 TaxID=3364098 RepID=UPI0037FA9905